MKIAITGHTEGIGEALAKVYSHHKHEIVGLSRRNGYNIRSLPKCLGLIESCDMLINNAQTSFAQTELLALVWERWRGQEDKIIMNISTMMTLHSNSTMNELSMEVYRVQKIALEEMHWRLRELEGSPKMILIKPGAIATKSSIALGHGGNRANTDRWANFIYDILEAALPDLKIPEIAVGPA